MKNRSIQVARMICLLGAVCFSAMTFAAEADKSAEKSTEQSPRNLMAGSS